MTDHHLVKVNDFFFKHIQHLSTERAELIVVTQYGNTPGLMGTGRVADRRLTGLDLCIDAAAIGRARSFHTLPTSWRTAGTTARAPRTMHPARSGGLGWDKSRRRKGMESPLVWLV